MTAPSLLTTSDARFHTRQVLKFGNATYPTVGGTQGWVDLNDCVSWFMQGIQTPTARKLGILPFAWRSKSAYISDDYDAMTVKVKMQYDETGGTSFQSVKGQLLAMGEQNLTTDNVTQVLAKVSFGSPSVIGGTVTPYLWAFDLDFVCKEPWLSDVTATTTSLTAGANSLSYAGGIFCEPIYTLTATSGTMTINNSTAGQSLTVLGLPGGSPTVVVNTQDWTAKIGATQYDVSGSFPFLFPGPTSPQTNTVSITNGSGSVSYNARWAL